MIATDEQLNLPEDLPERVKRMYRCEGVRFTGHNCRELYRFYMTEEISTQFLEKTYGLICFNYTGPVYQIILEWWEYDHTYAIILNTGKSEFVDLINARDITTPEVMYDKWLEIVSGILKPD